MANTVSTDALWGKLLEISEQLKTFPAGQISPGSSSEQSKHTPDLNGVKNEIFAKIESEADILGKHGDSNYKAINENIVAVDKKIDRIGNIIAHNRRHQKEAAGSSEAIPVPAGQQPGKPAGADSNAAGSCADEPSIPQNGPVALPGNSRKEYFSFWFFKIRKTTLIIVLLGLLVLLLTLFCMKQQNDYMLLMNEYYKYVNN